jgi:hypothetical protein
MKHFEQNYIFQTDINGRIPSRSIEDAILAKGEAEREIQHAIDLFHERTGLAISGVEIQDVGYSAIGGPYQVVTEVKAVVMLPSEWLEP